jgi:hypothetical protein
MGGGPDMARPALRHPVGYGLPEYR